jgi:large repetitive protein
MKRAACTLGMVLAVSACGPSASPSPTAPGATSSPTPSSPSPTSPPVASPSAPAVGAWQPAAPMNRGRTGFDAVLLGDGTVLAVGDDFSCFPGGAMAGSERAEVYDPNADKWTEVESLNRPRKMPATVVLIDGSAMVLGGLNTDDVPFSSTKIFSPSTRTWTDGPLLTIARGAPAATGLSDGRVLVVSTEGANPRASREIYDPESNAWSIAEPFPAGVGVERLIRLADDRVLALGFDTTATEPSPIAFLYDPDADSWTPVEAPAGIGYEVVALPDGSALAISGNDGGELFGGDGLLTTRVTQFDPATGQWTQVAPLTTPRIGFQAVTLEDGRVLVAGGETGGTVDTAGETVRSTELYDPTTDSWSAQGDILEPRKEGYLVALPDGGALLLGGNDDRNTEGDTPWCPEPLKTVELFTFGG